jgi:ComF family protein
MSQNFANNAVTQMLETANLGRYSSLKSLISSYFNHWLLPHSCFLCGATATHPICKACLADLPYQNLKNTCRYCASPMPATGVCGTCLNKPPPYTYTWALFSYTYPVDKLIHTAKFNDNLAVLDFLGELMAQQVIMDERPDVLVPVPLHIKRLRQRGYNQSSQLAKRISKRTGIPMSHYACERHKNTPPQVTQKSAKEREENIRDAFRISRLKPSWQHIVLVDDVVTTGSTVKELTRTFLTVETIQRVDVWCCAR